MTADPNDLEIDFMLLADGGQAVGGKLYVLGGGWSTLLLRVIPGPPPAPYSVAVGITVPSNLTDRVFSFTLELLDADGGRVGDILTFEFEAARPPGLLPGATQSLLLAANTRPEFPVEGRYSYHASIDGEPRRAMAFEVRLERDDGPSEEPATP